MISETTFVLFMLALGVLVAVLHLFDWRRGEAERAEIRLSDMHVRDLYEELASVLQQLDAAEKEIERLKALPPPDAGKGEGVET